MKNKLSNSGFTLIELMIVVAIVAILASLAIPAYQDYLARSQVSEAMSLAVGAKEAIGNYYADHGLFPSNNASAGLALPTSMKGKYIHSVAVDNAGQISVQFNTSAHAKIRGQTLVLQVTDNGGSLNWNYCTGLETKYLPSACR